MLYQGDEPWNTTQRLREIVDLEELDDDAEIDAELLDMVPDFRFELVPLIGIPPADLPREPLAHLGLTLMQAVIEHKYVEWCQAEAWAINLLLKREDGEQMFIMVLYYLFNAVPGQAEFDATVQALRSAIEPELEEQAMTGLEILEQRGERRGKEMALQKVVKNMLAKGFSVDEIVRLTETDREFVESVAEGEDQTAEEDNG